MQPTTILASILSLALAATAAPAVEVRNGGNGGSSSVCSAAGQQQVCCTGLSCLVQVLSDTCSQTALCCKTDAPVGTLISLNLLNCLSIL